MLLHRKKKIAIFLPPKTGTSTVTKMLTSHAGFDAHEGAHAFPHEIFGSKGLVLDDWSCFAFIREPWDRRESIVRYKAHMPLRENYTLEGVWLFPQRKWFFCRGIRVVQALDFCKFESKLRYLAGLVGAELPDEIPRINEGNNNFQVELAPACREAPPLAEDFPFYDDCRREWGLAF